MKNMPLFTLAMISSSLMMGCAWSPWSQSHTPQIVPHARIQDGGDSALAFYTLARHLHRQGRLDDAERAYRRALDFEPDHLEARNGLAALAASRGDLAQAIASLSSLVAAHPDQPHFIANLGYAHYLNGNYPQAKSLLQQAVSLSPDNASAQHKLALVLEKLGETVDSVVDTQQATLMPATLPAAHKASESGNQIVKMSEGIYALTRQSDLVPQVPLMPVLAKCDITEPVHTAQMSQVSADSAALIVSTESAAIAGSSVRGGISTVPPAIQSLPVSLRIELANGNGVRGLARSLRDLINGDQWQVIRVVNYQAFAVPLTRIEYAKSRYAAAHELADALGIVAQLRPNNQQSDTQLRLVLGHDFRTTEGLRERLSAYRAPALALNN